MNWVWQSQCIILIDITHLARGQQLHWVCTCTCWIQNLALSTIELANPPMPTDPCLTQWPRCLCISDGCPLRLSCWTRQRLQGHQKHTSTQEVEDKRCKLLTAFYSIAHNIKFVMIYCDCLFWYTPLLIAQFVNFCILLFFTPELPTLW